MVGGEKGEKKIKRKWCEETRRKENKIKVATSYFTFCYSNQELSLERVEFGTIML